MLKLWRLFQAEGLCGLFLSPTEDAFVQFFRYIFVGGAAFLADYALLFLLTRLGMHYLIAAIFSFIFGFLVNFAMGKWLVFQKEAPMGRKKELAGVLLISLVGLALTELLLFFFTEILYVHYMLSKIIAAGLVLIWNFLARKKWMYVQH